MWGFLRDSLKIPVDSVSDGSVVVHLNIDIAAAQGIKVLQEVRGTNAWNTYGEGFTWTKQFPLHGGRMLYTALGYEANDWTNNGAWLKKATYGYMRYLMGDFLVDLATIPPDIHVRGSQSEIRAEQGSNVNVTDLRGRLVAPGTGSDAERINLKPGVYFLSVRTAGGLSSKLIVIP